MNIMVYEISVGTMVAIVVTVATFSLIALLIKRWWLDKDGK